jgi:hypothetical protein
MRLSGGCTRVRVLEEQRLAVEAPRRAGLLVGAELERVVDVEVERKLERQRLADHDGVDRRPGRDRGQFERLVFGRQRVRGVVEVHALGVRGEPALRLGAHLLICRERRAPEPERAQLHVVREPGGADELGDLSAGAAPVEVHLEVAVARVRVAFQERRVVLVRGLDHRHALGVVLDRAGRAQHPGGRDVLGVRGAREREADREREDAAPHVALVPLVI